MYAYFIHMLQQLSTDKPKRIKKNTAIIVKRIQQPPGK